MVDAKVMRVSADKTRGKEVETYSVGVLWAGRIMTIDGVPAPVKLGDILDIDPKTRKLTNR